MTEQISPFMILSRHGFETVKVDPLVAAEIIVDEADRGTQRQVWLKMIEALVLSWKSAEELKLVDRRR
jgi:hypothetical protein